MKLVEVETRADLGRAINQQTAMMLFYNANNDVGQIKDEEFAGSERSLACRRSMMRPRTFRQWRTCGSTTGMGFDLVAFSGGKAMRGPRIAGLLLGRKDLLAAARLNGPPNSDTVGRGMKVNKEEMLGMLVAVDLYVKKNHEQERREFDKRAETIRKSATEVPGCRGGNLRARHREPRAALTNLLGRCGERHDGG